jgi:hypothetical protein
LKGNEKSIIAKHRDSQTHTINNELEPHREETFLRSLLQNTMYASNDACSHVRCHFDGTQRLAKVSESVNLAILRVRSATNSFCDYYDHYRGASATVNLQNQLAIAQSKDLSFAVKQVEEIANTGNHITAMLSTADLIQLGGYAAVEYCGGPAMIFNMGRKDIGSEGDVIQHSPETHAGSLVV